MNIGLRPRVSREQCVLQKKAFTQIGLHLKSIVSVGLLWNPLLGYLIGYVCRTFDIFCEQRQGGSRLEKIRGARGGQKPSSDPFGMIGFVKPILLDLWKGHRMVLSVYLGMRYVLGVGF